MSKSKAHNKKVTIRIDTFFTFSYGYPTSNTASASGTDASSTHLQNQNYMVCVRREKDYCYICWASWNSITADASFGLSNPAADMSHSGTGTNCVTDYVTVSIQTFPQCLEIPKNVSFSYRFRKVQLQPSLPQPPLQPLMIVTADESLVPSKQMQHLQPFVVSNLRKCCKVKQDQYFSIGRSYPFNIGITFDDSEICTAYAANTCEDDIQAANLPGGILGFALGKIIIISKCLPCFQFFFVFKDSPK